MKTEIKISNISDDQAGTESIVPDKSEVLARKLLLKGKTIGISISESDNLNELGYSDVHLKDAMIEVARYILALGGKIAYGGDIRQGGFTELMFDLLLYYKADKKLEPHERFYSYLSWPLSLNLTQEKEAELTVDVSFRRIDPPSDILIDNVNEFLKPDSAENLYIWSRCLTKMRNEMEDNCNARIFIGGRITGFKGKCPGILEELLIALGKNHPIYLVGAFGGITKDSINGLENLPSNGFLDAFYFQNANYKSMVGLYNSKHSTDIIAYDQYFSVLMNLGFKGLSKINGLTESENRRLAVTPHISEIVYLILKGLTNCFAL